MVRIGILMAQGQNVPIAVTGLTDGTEYVVYWVIRTGGLESAIISTPATTAVPTLTIANAEFKSGSATTTGFTVEYESGWAWRHNGQCLLGGAIRENADIPDSPSGVAGIKNATIDMPSIAQAGMAANVSVGDNIPIVIDRLPSVVVADVADPFRNVYNVFIVAETSITSSVVAVEDLSVTASTMAPNFAFCYRWDDDYRRWRCSW